MNRGNYLPGGTVQGTFGPFTGSDGRPGAVTGLTAAVYQSDGKTLVSPAVAVTISGTPIDNCYPYSLVAPAVAGTYVVRPTAGTTAVGGNAIAGYWSDDFTVALSSTVVSSVSPLQPYATSYTDLQSELATEFFGVRPVNNSLTLTSDQSLDIDRCIRAGLQAIYSAYRWSFMRPVVPVVTHPAYRTGTVVIITAGAVALTGGTFPTNAFSAGGMLSIPSGTYSGGWPVLSYVGPSALTIDPSVTVATATSFSLWFNRYPMPLGFDSLEEDFTFPANVWLHRNSVRKVDELLIRRAMTHAACPPPAKPEMYALATDVFDPTKGSSRSAIFWPPPDLQYTLSAKATLRPFMLDSVNQYPLGAEVLSPCIMEACLAAGKRLIDKKDATAPDALLQLAIQQDKQQAAPDSLGVDQGHEGRGDEGFVSRRQTQAIYWDAGGYQGYL